MRFRVCLLGVGSFIRHLGRLTGGLGVTGGSRRVVQGKGGKLSIPVEWAPKPLQLRHQNKTIRLNPEHKNVNPPKMARALH